ncbi:MAG: aspartyl protease [Paracoccaceae bacterium]|nr:MAG: TIGR02281 family clan AA aspartic protease [Alphaproteobacteria bacterium]GIX15690.1 MAG: aspartyl protease [Paracoccaceae bacterium]
MSGLDPDSQARLFYLAVLIIALIGGVVFQYRGRLGQALQNIAIWGLIFCGLVLVYGFREELAMQLSIGRPQEVSPGEIRLRRGADGHFHARVEVEGVMVDFMIDTGATDIVLSPEDARRVGFDIDALAYTRRAATANGTVMGAPVILRVMRLGPFVDHEVPAVVNSAPLPRSLLGMRYLERFALLRIEGGRLTLAR